MLYVTKPEAPVYVEALRMRRSNAARVDSFTDGRLRFRDGHIVGFIDTLEDLPRPIPLKGWVVKNPDRSLFFLSKKEFKNRYCKPREI